MSNVREIIQSSMRDNGLAAYERQAEPVITALESKVYEVADVLRHRAQQAGISRADATAAIEEAGLTFRPEPVRPSGEAGLAGEVAALRDQVGRLTEFARRHGLR